MQLQQINWSGPPVDDEEILARLPANLAGLLRQINGFVQFSGGLHVRGACLKPAWHSLRDAWLGEHAFHRHYPEVRPDDVPFAEDCLGDQFLLRDQVVWSLAAETGGMESLGVSLFEFLESVQADPVEQLSLHPLMQFTHEGGSLEPGQLLDAFPPFCTEQSADGVSLRAVPAEERRWFLADLARQVRALPPGSKVEFKAGD